MTRFSLLAVALAVLGSAVAIPVEVVESLANAGRGETVTKNLATDRAPCNKQSCEIANLSGSTGKMPTYKPEGGDTNGYKCIARWNPEGVALAKTLPPGPRQNTGFSGALTGGIASLGGALTFSKPNV
jgi:hypothetical protein